MKLIIQIPCLNEEEHLPATLAALPKAIPGIDQIETLIIDDGSIDNTASVARKLGVDHVVRHANNRGLAKAFSTGIEACLRCGADIIVNTDADNQYDGGCIADLVRPILNGEADIVLGDRQVGSNVHFSWSKRLLQKLGSFAVRRLSGTDVTDAVSGFRAFSRKAASRLNIVSNFSYTIETLIQAGEHKLAISVVPISTNAVTRPSRLFKSIPNFIRNSVVTMGRIYAMYHPLRTFLWIGAVLFALGALPILRFLYFYYIGEGSGHIQSLIIGGSLMVLGFLTLLYAVIADLIGTNRKLLEAALTKIRELEDDVRGLSAKTGSEAYRRDIDDQDDQPRTSAGGL